MIHSTQALNIEILDWGRIPYQDAWKKQKELLELRKENKIPDTFIFCEHDPVITIGRSKEKENELPFVAPKNIPVLQIERGGLATYHGPGQLVCYPIVRLLPASETQFPGGIVAFIRRLEDWMIDVLASYNVPALRIDKKTGVWVDAGKLDGGAHSSLKKIGSIGIAVSRWVTYHGLAFNFATGIEPWLAFNPCGFSGDIMTDLQYEMSTATKLNYSDVAARFIKLLH